MNYKIEEINLFLYELQELSKEVIDERQVYLQLITYHLPNKDKLKDLTDCLIPIIKKYEKKFKISNLKRFYILENKKNTKNNFSIKIHVPLSEKTLSKDLGKIIDYLSKSKIDFTCKISVVYRVDTVIIDVYNEKDTIKIIQFLNKP